MSARLSVGRSIALSNNYLGLDEVERQSPDLVEDYVQMRQREERYARLWQRRNLLSAQKKGDD